MSVFLTSGVSNGNALLIRAAAAGRHGPGRGSGSSWETMENQPRQRRRGASNQRSALGEGAPTAGGRGPEAGQREVLAGEREAPADGREHDAGQRKRDIGERTRSLVVLVEDMERQAEATIARSRTLVEA